MQNKLIGLSSIVSLLILFSACFVAYTNLEIRTVNKRGITFNTETKIPMKDRMDLAWEQEFELTKDPALGIVPKERLLDAWKYKQQLLINSGLGKAAIPGVTWVERGPKNFGGRTRCVMVDLNDANHKTLWAGSVAGGLWKTTDITVANPVWTPLNDFFDNLAITHIDQAPSNPQIMYFCTGEGNSNLDAVRGLGVWKSTNGGTSWTQLTSTNNSSYYYCQKVVSIGNGDTVFVLTKSGLFRSVNGGTAFSKVLGSGISSAGGDIAYDFEVMKNGTLYVTMSSGATNGGTIHKSYNRGTTWTTPLPLPSYLNRDEMEIAVSANDTNIIYVLVESSGRIQRIMKSVNAGVSFDSTAVSPVDADGGVSTTTYPYDFSRGQGWYDLSLAVDPANPNVVVVGGVDLFKTTNGGTTWTQISHWYGGFGFQEVHADQHYACFDPASSDICYFSNDGGVYRSANFTNSSPVIDYRGAGYNTLQFYACDIHPTAGSNQYVAGAQDNGSHSFTTAGLNNTTEVTGGDGAFCHIDQDQSTYWFTSYVYTSYYRSTNGGSSFSNVLNTSQNVGSFINPSDYDDVNNRMYLCGNNGTFVRWDNPQTGSTIVFDTVALFNSGKVTHVKVSPNVSNRVYFGMNNGRVIRIDNAHLSTTIDSFLNNGKGMPTGSISCIEAETGNDNHLLVTYSNYGVTSVWETKDGGLNWTSVEGNLPDMPVRWVIFNPNKNWQAMIATELGVWTTDSLRGSTTNWQPSNSGFSNVRTDMLKLRSSDKQVIAATHGRGLFSSNVFSPPFADFSANKTLTYISAFVQFTSTSNGATSYLWDFGDGTTSVLQNPVKQYSTAGVYNVTLTINGGVSSKTISSYIKILPYRAVPYTPALGGDFESNPNDFGAETLSGVAFVRGNSTTSGKNGTASGSNAWVTGLTGNYADNSDVRLYSPCFNCSAAGTYTLKFKVKNRFEIGYDGYIIEYSLNLGNTWTKLGSGVQTNWYDFANSTANTSFPMNSAYFNVTRSSYTQMQYNFSTLAGNSKVAFRVVFKSDDASNDVGMAFDDFEIAGPSNPAMPVDLLAFTGVRLPNSYVNLNWTTASEKNNKGFEVERSENGFRFETIGFVSGSGNSALVNKYEFRDLTAPQDYLYYRLKQIDKDGAYRYSPVVAVDSKSADQKPARVFVDLISGNLHIEVAREEVTVLIRSSSGAVVWTGSRISGNNVIPITELPQGIYVVEMYTENGQSQAEKILWIR